MDCFEELLEISEIKYWRKVGNIASRIVINDWNWTKVGNIASRIVINDWNWTKVGNIAARIFLSNWNWTKVGNIAARIGLSNWNWIEKIEQTIFPQIFCRLSCCKHVLKINRSNYNRFILPFYRNHSLEASQ